MSCLISIIINTKNEEANITRCIRSVQDSVFGIKDPESAEILVVDNYSTDKTATIAKKLGAKVFKKGPERSTQKNFGAKEATGQILFFVDADMEVNLLVIQQATSFLKKNPKIKAIIVPEASAGENFWARARALEMSCYLCEPAIEAARIFDKKTFFKAGGFDEKLIAAEDWDLHQRIQKWGKVGRIKAKLIHHQDQLSLTNHLKKKYYYAKNIKFYARKHPKVFILQSAFHRIKIFLKNRRLFAADPLHTLGLFILKSLEYSVYLLAKCQGHASTPLPDCSLETIPDRNRLTPKVSIVFPTFNGWQDTKECLESIRQLNYPKKKLEVIIVDNASMDGTVKKVQRYKGTRVQSKIKLIKNRTNLGFAKAVNQGIKKAKGEYLLITNNDVIFDQNYLANLVEFLQKNPQVGITGGKVYYKHPKKKIIFAGARFSFYTGLIRLGKSPNRISETDWVSGSNMLIRREVFEKIGLFDENFFFYFEDLDLCLRAKKAGYQVIYYPRAIQYHDEGQSINRQKWQKKSELHYQGKTRILFKHATKIQLLSTLIFQFFFILPYHLLVLKHQNFTPAIKTLFENIFEANWRIHSAAPEVIRGSHQSKANLPSKKK